jgi:2-keto-3-deoxy-6-phosphogluconate aldolase
MEDNVVAGVTANSLKEMTPGVVSARENDAGSRSGAAITKLLPASFHGVITELTLF